MKPLTSIPIIVSFQENAWWNCLYRRISKIINPMKPKFTVREISLKDMDFGNKGPIHGIKVAQYATMRFSRFHWDQGVRSILERSAGSSDLSR